MPCFIWLNFAPDQVSSAVCFCSFDAAGSSTREVKAYYCGGYCIIERLAKVSFCDMCTSLNPFVVSDIAYHL